MSDNQRIEGKSYAWLENGEWRVVLHLPAWVISAISKPVKNTHTGGFTVANIGGETVLLIQYLPTPEDTDEHLRRVVREELIRMAGGQSSNDQPAKTNDCHLPRVEWDALSPDEQFAYMQLCETRDNELHKLLLLIPPCPMHGHECLPNAHRWLREARLPVDVLETQATADKAEVS